MLTCKTLSSTQATNYFVKGYLVEENSRWYGKGAAKLSLVGEIDNETVFANVVMGYSPNGKRKLAAKDLEGEKRRAGVDCTFSAPKSVSLTALVGRDDRLFQAHCLAVEKTLAVIEERYAQTRIRVLDERNTVKTGNLVVAQFDHIETRELDPHLHTHCLIMNMTEVEKGKWYSHHNNAIFENKKFLGTLYQHHLAIEVQKLGYEIEDKGKGQFEIKGYQTKDLEHFSKRRQQIQERVGKDSLWYEREKAWNDCRKKKKVVHPDDLKADWKEQAKLLGIRFVESNNSSRLKEYSSDEQDIQNQKSLGKKLDSSLQSSKIKDFNSQPTTQQQDCKDESEFNESLNDAIAHCSERNVAFKKEALETFILAEHRPVDFATLDAAIAVHPELIALPTEKGMYYTTQTAVLRELATIRLMLSGKDTVQAIVDPKILQEKLDSISLTQGQKEAIFSALTTSDQVIAWQGVAGAGKTYALNHFSQLAQNQNYVIKGFAPSAEAAKVLGDEVGIEGNTVASLHESKPPETIEPNQVWIVDEAGLLSAKAAHQLLERAADEKARIIFVGDTRQLSAVEAGNPFKSLQNAGMTTAYMDQSLRQRVEHLQLAVDAIAQGEISTGFSILDLNGCIQSTTDDQDKATAIVNDYIALAPDERAKTLIVAGTNQERLEITAQIRSRLYEEGNLTNSSEITKLKAKNLTTIQMKYAHNLAINDVVMPTKDYKRRGLEKGKFYTIVAKEEDRLTLKNAEGFEITVDLGFEKAIYTQNQIEIAQGDRLKWIKNDRNLGRRNGQEFRVTSLEGNTATIAYDDGKSEILDLTQPLHLDHALVTTTYSSQGKTADRVLISADYTIAQESFYVAVSRSKYNLKLYTTDKEELLERAKQSKAKENPLELVRAAARLNNLTQPVEEDKISVVPPVRKVLAEPQNIKLQKSIISQVPVAFAPSEDTDSQQVENREISVTIHMSQDFVHPLVEQFLVLGKMSDSSGQPSNTKTNCGTDEPTQQGCPVLSRLNESPENPLKLLTQNHEPRNYTNQQSVPVEPDRETARKYGGSNSSNPIAGSGNLERLCETINRTAIARTIGGLRGIVEGINRINQQLHNGIKSNSDLAGEIENINEQFNRRDQKTKRRSRVTRNLDKVGQPSIQQVNCGTDRLTQQGCPTLSDFYLGDESPDTEQKLVDAIKQRQIAKFIQKPLVQLKTTLQRIESLSSNDPVINQIQILKQSLKPFELEALRTVSEVKLQTLSNAIAQWKVAKSSYQSKAENPINKALQKFTQTINEVKQTFEDERLINLDLAQLQSSIELAANRLREDESNVISIERESQVIEQRLVEAIAQKQLAKLLKKPLVQLKETLRQIESIEPHHSVVSPIQTLEQSIKQFGQAKLEPLQKLKSVQGQRQVDLLFPLCVEYLDANEVWEIGNYQFSFDSQTLVLTCYNQSDPDEFLRAFGTEDGWQYQEGMLAELNEEDLFELLQELLKLEDELEL